MTTGTHDNSLVSLPDAKESKLALASKAVDQERQPLDARFWLVFLGIGIATMITALELVRSLLPLDSVITTPLTDTRTVCGLCCTPNHYPGSAWLIVHMGRLGVYTGRDGFHSPQRRSLPGVFIHEVKR